MYQIDAKIISNKEIAPEHFLLVLRAPKIAKAAKPGQFIHVRISKRTDPLLRRPFSIYAVRSRGFGVRSVEILYKVVGKGTDILSKKKPGEYLDVIGPLGNGFSLPTPNSQLPTTTIIVAGGMGVAPLVFLAEKLVRSKEFGVRGKRDINVIIGARNKECLICEKDFKKSGIKTIVCTDDGSKGKRALASEGLERLLRSSILDPRSSMIYACGPKPMLEAVAKIAQKRNIPCQVSLEEKMGCGVGACMSCVVKTKDGYKRVCKDGPVFDAGEIIWR